MATFHVPGPAVPGLAIPGDFTPGYPEQVVSSSYKFIGQYFLTPQPTTAPAGIPYVASTTPGTRFTVKSTSGSDTAVVVGWQIVESV